MDLKDKMRSETGLPESALSFFSSLDLIIDANKAFGALVRSIADFDTTRARLLDAHTSLPACADVFRRVCADKPHYQARVPRPALSDIVVEQARVAWSELHAAWPQDQVVTRSSVGTGDTATPPTAFTLEDTLTAIFDPDPCTTCHPWRVLFPRADPEAGVEQGSPRVVNRLDIGYSFDEHCSLVSLMLNVAIVFAGGDATSSGWIQKFITALSELPLRVVHRTSDADAPAGAGAHVGDGGGAHAAIDAAQPSTAQQDSSTPQHFDGVLSSDDQAALHTISESVKLTLVPCVTDLDMCAQLRKDLKGGHKLVRQWVSSKYGAGLILGMDRFVCHERKTRGAESQLRTLTDAHHASDTIAAFRLAPTLGDVEAVVGLTYTYRSAVLAEIARISEGQVRQSFIEQHESAGGVLAAFVTVVTDTLATIGALYLTQVMRDVAVGLCKVYETVTADEFKQADEAQLETLYSAHVRCFERAPNHIPDPRRVGVQKIANTSDVDQWTDNQHVITEFCGACAALC